MVAFRDIVVVVGSVYFPVVAVVLSVAVFVLFLRPFFFLPYLQSFFSPSYLAHLPFCSLLAACRALSSAASFDCVCRRPIVPEVVIAMSDSTQFLTFV